MCAVVLAGMDTHTSIFGPLCVHMFHSDHTYTYISMVSIYVSVFAGMRGTVLPGEGTMSLCLHGAYSASNTIA